MERKKERKNDVILRGRACAKEGSMDGEMVVVARLTKDDFVLFLFGVRIASKPSPSSVCLKTDMYLPCLLLKHTSDQPPCTRPPPPPRYIIANTSHNPIISRGHYIPATP